MSEFQKAHIKRIETDNKRKKTIIEKLKVENKKLRKDILMFQTRYMGLLPINKKLRECVDKLWEIKPDKTEMLDILQKCLKDIDEDE